MELGPADADRSHRVPAGERVTVRLPETPTTGYRWEPDVDAAELRLVDDRFEGDTEPRGAAGVRVLTFEPARAGTLTLRVALRRSWEASGGDVVEFRLEVAGG